MLTYLLLTKRFTIIKLFAVFIKYIFSNNKTLDHITNKTAEINLKYKLFRRRLLWMRYNFSG